MSLPPEFTPLIAIIGEIIALGAFVLVVGAILGRFWDEAVREFLQRISFLIGICLVGYILLGGVGFVIPAPNLAARASNAQVWATAGLVIAVVAATGMAIQLGKKDGTSEPGKRRGVRFFLGLWLGFCFASWIGHAAGGWVGLLTITVPATLIFWLLLYYLARFILPLDENQSVSTAFRCLLTFSAGTNYPYYIIEDREKVERVPGNQFKQHPIAGSNIFGPGIFLTGPDHVVAVSDGLRFTGVRGPGVVFTYLFESIQQPMELRPQQRPYTVEAITKDGIEVKFNTFGPFQLDAGNQRPELGKPFPVHASSVFKAFHAQPIDIQRGKRNEEVVEEREKRRWDELYEMIGTHVMQDIIADYTFDELCEPLNLERDPRTEIAAKYRDRMRQELSEHGIKIPGGGISNLFPADKETVLKRRIMNWQAQWQRRILQQHGLAEAEVERLIGRTRARIQADMIRSISEAIAEVAADDEDIFFNTVALRFIDSLNQMVAQPKVEERLPPGVAEIVKYDLPRIIGEE